MFELKKKLINYLLKNGNKLNYEKFILNFFKDFNKILKKKIIRILNFIINWYSLIFNIKNDFKNKSVFFIHFKFRSLYAIKYSIKFKFYTSIRNLSTNFKKMIFFFRENFQLKLLNEKFMFFYRW